MKWPSVSNIIQFPTGILAIAKPCSIVVDVKELFGSESKTQVYAHLHELMQSKAMETIGIVPFSIELFFNSNSLHAIFHEKANLKVTVFNFFISDTICYDDACHLKKFSQNPSRSQLTTTSNRLSSMVIVCDRFHFKNHTDSWCKKNCNPYTCSKLQVTANFNALVKYWANE